MRSDCVQRVWASVRARGPEAALAPSPWAETRARLVSYLEVWTVPGVLRLHLVQQRLQVAAQPGPWIRHVLEGGLQRGPQGVDVCLRHQRACEATGVCSCPPQPLAPGWEHVFGDHA